MAVSEAILAGLQHLARVDPVAAEHTFLTEAKQGNRDGYLYLAALRRASRDLEGARGFYGRAANPKLYEQLRAAGRVTVMAGSSGVLTGRGTCRSQTVGAIESLYDQRELDEAVYVDELRKLMTSHDDGGAARDSYAWFLMQQGRMDDARRYYREALELLDGDMRTRSTVEYGLLLAITGEGPAGRQLWEQTMRSGHVEHGPAAAVMTIRHDQGTLVFAAVSPRPSAGRTWWRRRKER